MISILKSKKLYLMPVLGFILLIFVFSILLLLPISTTKNIGILNAIFLSASAITGTGFSTVSLVQDLTVVGQVILLIGVQLGALGLMFTFSFFLLLRKKKVSLSDSMIISSEINYNNHSKIKEKIYRIIKYTFFIEFIGAMILGIFFVPREGVFKGIWFGIFHSISAFCNAGFDILGDNSFIDFQGNIGINIVLYILMISGSIGFFVIDDLWNFIKNKNKKLQLHSKLVLKTSIILLVALAAFLKIFSPELTWLQSIFTSATARSTGFTTVDLNTLDYRSKLLISIFMFIGGTAGSTAGGIKVTTFAILVLLPLSTIKDQELVVYHKRIDLSIIRKAITITVTYLFLTFVAFFIMLSIENFNSIDLFFQLISGFSNTGLSVFDINSFSNISKIIIIIYMYLGRIGPVTFFALFSFKENKNNIKYPDADLML